MAIAIKEARPVRGEEAVAERPDGSRVPFIAFPTPIFDQHGELTGAINMLVDITDRKQAEEYAERLAAIVTSSSDAIVGMDLSAVINSWNEGAERLYGYRAEEALGKPVAILVPAELPEEEASILRRIRMGERIEQFETVRLRKDGSLVDVSLTVSPIKNGNGAVIGASKIARDISERKREEERRKLLVNELNHRVKNTLATIQSIAAQTFREGDADAPKRFEKRLMALSQAHDVLTVENWRGADFADIVHRTTGLVSDARGGRFEISGPSLWLQPREALSLAMAMHELCTNAAKYGALSNDTGRVHVQWERVRRGDEAALLIRWREQDGPPVEPPRRSGFGTRMLQRALVLDLGARVDVRFPATGLTCEIEAPIS
jgi:PAS domain S-box-containing protein